MIPLKSIYRSSLPIFRQRSAIVRPTRRHRSSQGLDSNAIAELLSKPTWSVESLHAQERSKNGRPSITAKELHHVLRLSALPIPESAAEEAEMINTLEDQLNFVRAVRAVDTNDIQPLRSIRDETKISQCENEITDHSLKEHFDNESATGFARKIVRKPPQASEMDEAEQYDPVSRASKTIGRYVAVNVKES